MTQAFCPPLTNFGRGEKSPKYGLEFRPQSHLMDSSFEMGQQGAQMNVLKLPHQVSMMKLRSALDISPTPPIL